MTCRPPRSHEVLRQAGHIQHGRGRQFLLYPSQALDVVTTDRWSKEPRGENDGRRRQQRGWIDEASSPVYRLKSEAALLSPQELRRAGYSIHEL